MSNVSEYEIQIHATFFLFEKYHFILLSKLRFVTLDFNQMYVEHLFVGVKMALTQVPE